MVEPQKEILGADRVRWAADQLERWYAAHGRHELPWRQRGTTAYSVWVSEIMLQQTQVRRVIPYYLRFVQRFPVVQSLAAATWDDFLPYYQGLGYYQRGRNMLKTALIVTHDFGGQFPPSPQQLARLPGIGRYTASAIASFAFQLPVLAFDTNHQRLWARFLHGNRHESVDVPELEHTLAHRVSPELNAAVMDFANTLCTQKPHCDDCPLRSHCRYFQTHATLEPQATRQRTAFPHKSAFVQLTLHENHQKYYSAHNERYEPFSLSPPTNTRTTIKAYFSQHYGLTLAVRPPHKKMYIHGQPTLCVNAQILSGNPPFRAFDKHELSL